jgi:hypothetical protein
MVVRQPAIWNLRSEDAVWTGLRRTGCRDRFDGMDGIFCDGHFSRRSLERRKHVSLYFFGVDAADRRRALSSRWQRLGNPRGTTSSTSPGRRGMLMLLLAKRESVADREYVSGKFGR